MKPRRDRVRVVKLGGSLLDLDQLSDRVGRWMEANPACPNVFLIGGGAWADAVRAAHRLHQIDGLAAHWLCIRAMSVTAELVAAITHWPLVDDWRQPAHKPPAVSVFECHRFLRDVEPALPGTPLPHGWHVTSDSIAARLAEVLGAEELVLLKSALPPAPPNLTSAADQNFVDPWFPTAARALRSIRIVNLRSATYEENEFFPTPTHDPQPPTPSP
jgi:hypothetical protein